MLNIPATTIYRINNNNQQFIEQATTTYRIDDITIRK